MIKVRIIFTGYLKNKYLTKEIELNYKKPVKIHKVLRECKISTADVFFITVRDLIIKEDYLLTRSEEVKLLPVIGGG